MLKDIEKILCVKKVLNLELGFCLNMSYSSFMARYDLYTDIIFGLQTYTCKKLNAEMVGVLSLITIGLNLFFLFLG